jgi:DNA modification methylase
MKEHYKHSIKKVSDLIPYVNNSRTHSDEQVNQVAASIKEFGFTSPVLIDEQGGLIAGHGRVMAAKKLKLDEVPCIILEGLTEAQKKAYIIADNQLPLNAGWDLDKLKLEVETLQELDFDIEVLGFDDEFLDGLLDVQMEEGLTDEDEVPEAPEVPVSVLGDIWQLGNHRLMCGDSTSTTDVEKLMDGHKADMVFTDPPYNTGMTEKKQGDSTRLSHMFNDSYTDSEWEAFMSDFCNEYDLATKDNAFIFVCLDWRRSHELVPHLKQRWKFSNLIIWDKMVHGLGSDYKYTHEFIHVCKKGKPPLATNKEGEKEYQDVWRIQRKMGRSEEHATKKPIELCERAIRHGSSYKNLVLDLFCGSGSTLIACEKNNRACYTNEMDARYVDVTIRRFEEFTGTKATHIESGKTYEELKQERLS